jgi:hypothetical protein
LRRWRMGSMVGAIKVGMIGLSPGNGHPFSMACIINGYNEQKLKSSGWDVIYNYVKIQDQSEFTFPDVSVTHVWTQDLEISNKIARSANIPNVVVTCQEMIGEVDAVIIARDDYETHFLLAKPFLEAGCYVFIDKPLSLDVKELQFFKSYMERGYLMSCSGMRYAKELDVIRSDSSSLGIIKLIRGTVLNDFEKYGVHMLDSIFGCVSFQVESVASYPANHQSAVLFNKDGSIIQIDALGPVVKTFQVDFFGSAGRFHAELNDNFTAFRRTLFHFFKMIRSGKPSIEPANTISIMKVILAYRMSVLEKRTVQIKEICLD